MIVKNTAYEAWKDVLKLIMREGKNFKDDNNRICRECFNLLIRLKNPGQKITKPINILNDFKNWKYPPLEEIKKVMLSNKLAPDYSYSYGPRIFNFQGRIDQINDFVIPLLKDKRTSRKATITLLDPVQDSSMVKRDVPGLVVIDFKVRKGKLNMTAVIRSNDLFFGWPANIYQLYVLMDFVSKKLDCEIGILDTFSISAHIFEDQFEYIKRILE
jgi:thymidylate synthase